MLELDATNLEPLTIHKSKHLVSLFPNSDHLVPARKNAYYAIDRFLLPGTQHKHEGLRSIFWFSKSFNLPRVDIHRVYQC